jgi:preprotein translocase subunit SecG
VEIETIELVLTVALVLDALALIALIMIQQGKGASVGAAFGSGASQTMFGSAGASSFLNTLTTWLAVGFFLVTFGLAWTARERAQSLGTVGIPQVEERAPEAPAPIGLPVEDDFPTLQIEDAPAEALEVPASPEEGGDVPAAPGDGGDDRVP